MTLRGLFFILVILTHVCQMYSQEMKDHFKQEIDLAIQKNIAIPDDFYQKLLLKYPNSLYVIGMRIYSTVKRGEMKEAENFINMYSTIIDASTYTLMACGVFEKVKGNRDKCLELFEKALKIDVNRDNKWLRLELAYYNEEEENENMSWMYLEESLNIDSNFIPALIVKSYALDQIENCTEIIELLEGVLKNYKDENVYAYIGGAYYNCLNIEKAEHYLSLSINIRKTADAYEVLGHISHYEYKDYIKALEYYEESLKIDPKSPEIRNSIGWLYFDMGKLEEAEKEFLYLIELDSSQEPYNQVILFYLYSEQYKKAAKKIKESKKINGQSFSVDGLEIILQIIRDPDSVNTSVLMKNYESKYGEFEINWLQGVLNNIE